MKKKFIGMVIILIVCLLSTTVYGALAGTTQLTASDTTVNPGDEITVTLRVSGITGSTTGVAGFESKLVYDAEIFETVTVEDITSSWTVENMNPTTLISLLTTTPVTADTNIFSIKFTVKSDAELGETTIGLNEATIYNLQETASTTVSNLTITIEEPEEEVNNTVPTNTNTNVNRNTNTNTNRNTTANQILPKTGTDNIIFLIISSITIIALMSYINYRKNKEI